MCDEEELQQCDGAAGLKEVLLSCPTLIFASSVFSGLVLLFQKQHCFMPRVDGSVGSDSFTVHHKETLMLTS